MTQIQLFKLWIVIEGVAFAVMASLYVMELFKVQGLRETLYGSSQIFHQKINGLRESLGEMEKRAENAEHKLKQVQFALDDGDLHMEPADD